MKTMYSRRQVMGIGLGSLAGLTLSGLAGCDTPATTTQFLPSQGPASLQMFFWGSATRDKFTRQAINLFHKRYPDTTIGSQYSGNDTYYIKLDKKIASGNAPDLIQMDMRYIAQYVRRGTLLDLSQLIYNQTINLSDFDPILLTGSKVNNAIYGVPLGSNYQCMYYDRTLIEKAGLGPVPDNMSWATFGAYATELSRALGGTIYGTADGSVNYDNFEIWIRSRGKELYTQQGKLAFELTDVMDWFNFWSNLRKAKGCVPMGMQATMDLTGTPTDSTVIKGKAVFGHLFSNQYEAFQKATTHTLGLVSYPRENAPGLYLKASQLLSIFANTKYQIQSANFCSFVINDPGAVKALGFERGVPGSLQGLSVLKPQFTPTQQTIVAFMNHIASTGGARIKEVLDPPAAGHIADSLLHIGTDIGNGKISPSDGAKQFYTDAQKATA
jgi:pectin-derived oligosaccharide transport system substrate-binding protein